MTTGRGFSVVSRETTAALDAYRALLIAWGQRLNLVSKAELSPEALTAHIEDSLSLVPYLPPGLDRFIDIGSGGGLPAVPIALATRVHADLIEADRRKAAFLQTALAKLDAPGTVWRERIETTQAPPARCVTARALAPLDKLLDLAHPLLAPAGCALFLKGPQVHDEVEIARRRWHMEAEVFDGFEPRSKILKITDLRPSYVSGSAP
ncbi:MAG: 16S rRNA (guanine(527)-N(7))-methyltransferase RsmG [Acetobacteraceae bacterium]